VSRHGLNDPFDPTGRPYCLRIAGRRRGDEMWERESPTVFVSALVTPVELGVRPLTVRVVLRWYRAGQGNGFQGEHWNLGLHVPDLRIFGVGAGSPARSSRAYPVGEHLHAWSSIEIVQGGTGVAIAFAGY